MTARGPQARLSLLSAACAETQGREEPLTAGRPTGGFVGETRITH